MISVIRVVLGQLETPGSSDEERGPGSSNGLREGEDLGIREPRAVLTTRKVWMVVVANPGGIAGVRYALCVIGGSRTVCGSRFRRPLLLLACGAPKIAELPHDSEREGYFPRA